MMLISLISLTRCTSVLSPACSILSIILFYYYSCPKLTFFLHLSNLSSPYLYLIADVADSGNGSLQFSGGGLLLLPGAFPRK